MAKNVIIFDVEGTLLDCVPHVLESWQVTLAEAGHTVLRSDLQRYSGMDGNDMLEHVLPKSDETERKRLLKLQGERYRRSYMTLARPFRGVADLVGGLARNNYRLAVATTCKGDELESYDGHMRILKYMEAVACGDDASKGKPHPDLFYEVLKNLGVTQPHRAIAVGDTPYDALAAKALGLRAVGVLTGGFSAQELKAAGCDAVLSEVNELKQFLRASA
jgi:phosphoglycolate phosphatase-like HAD superfamily hydrolase